MTSEYRNSLKKVADNLMAEIVKKDANWHTIELIGRELIVLARNARIEQVRKRQEYILRAYERRK